VSLYEVRWYSGVVPVLVTVSQAYGMKPPWKVALYCQ
jgi:hypothetical protein